MKVTVIPIVCDALGMVPKSLEKGIGELEIRGGIETMKIITLVRSSGILRRFLYI